MNGEGIKANINLMLTVSVHYAGAGTDKLVIVFGVLFTHTRT